MTITRNYSGALSVLEIHLDRIRRNYLMLQKMLTRGADCAAVVKADSYGLGAQQIVPELHAENCRHFFVSQAGEAFDVRDALGIREAQVYTLHGPHGATAAALTEKNIVPVLNSLDDIAYWAASATAIGKKLPAIIHIDTGMNRLGLSMADVLHLRNDTTALKPLDIRYIMSHLSSADMPAHPENAQQLEKFKNAVAALCLPARLSFANSSGIFLGQDYHFDLARPGVAIYGINPQPDKPNPMQGVITLKSNILQIRNATKGDTVGYGATYTVAKNAKLATISVGYADGYSRHLTGKGQVFIKGQKCPVVGRVSMDAIVADVTDVAGINAGDWADIIGDHQTADDVATQAGTIGYEVLTSLGRRYKRIYSGRET